MNSSKESKRMRSGRGKEPGAKSWSDHLRKGHQGGGRDGKSCRNVLIKGGGKMLGGEQGGTRGGRGETEAERLSLQRPKTGEKRVRRSGVERGKTQVATAEEKMAQVVKGCTIRKKGKKKRGTPSAGARFGRTMKGKNIEERRSNQRVIVPPSVYSAAGGNSEGETVGWEKPQIPTRRAAQPWRKTRGMLHSHDEWGGERTFLPTSPPEEDHRKTKK